VRAGGLRNNFGSSPRAAGLCQLRAATPRPVQELPTVNLFLAYLWVFLASLAVDLIPFIGPPAWIAMVFFMMVFF